MRKIKIPKIDNIIIKSLDEFYSLIQTGRNQQAMNLAKKYINICKKIIYIGKPDDNKYNSASMAIFLGILLRGLQDYISIKKIIEKDNWQNDNGLIEEVWMLMWDCKIRLEYGSNLYNHKVISIADDMIKSLKQLFLSKFGPGMYFSPDIIIEKVVCSICKRDFRACEHISGRIYNGTICRRIPGNVRLKSISLVEVPADPRCRVWPWRLKEDRTMEAMVLSSFRLDDFLDKS